ncbi:MAG: DUF2007 domain-containing protein [Pseudomonadota bacterium]|nr:DUF2007 domain-containing protein [Sphingomonas sp.]MDQ3483222.1 DUF2007 domain-containing protein [Pseudomonadota bacterium]
MSSLVELARYSTRVEADLARLALEAEGIEAVLFGAEMSGLGFGSMLPVRLMVLDEDAGAARALLAEDNR